MQYQPTRDQRELVEVIETSINAILPLSRLHVSHCETVECWNAIEELGLFLLPVPESNGGLGLGLAVESLVHLALGRNLASPGLLATLACAGENLSTSARVAPTIAGSETAAIMCDGASHLLVKGSSAALYGMPTVTEAPVDSGWLAHLQICSRPSDPIVTFDAKAASRLRLLDAAALAGIADAATQCAVDYAVVRQQFGRPIGSFQAVKHHCANMAMRARAAIDLVTFAAVAADHDRLDARRLIDCAYLMASSAAIENAGLNIQVHGGIGFSDEADAHLFLKRARLMSALGGASEQSLDRIAAVH